MDQLTPFERALLAQFETLAHGSEASLKASKAMESALCQRGLRPAHADQLPCWIHKVNPSPDLRNKAAPTALLRNSRCAQLK
jgi:hypothetical protein